MTTNTNMINPMTIHSPYTSLWFPNMEEWIAILFALNLAIQLLRLTLPDKECQCNEKYRYLIEHDAELVEKYNTLVDNFHENDATHVDDYNNLIDENNALEARISELEDQLAEKTGRTSTLRKRIRRLESRIARNAKTYKE